VETGRGASYTFLSTSEGEIMLEICEEHSADKVNPLFQEGWKLVHVCASDPEVDMHNGEEGHFRYILVRGSTLD
jgi:hypothetical protein